MPQNAAGAACETALATYVTCVDQALLRCEDEAFLKQVAAIKASYALICAGQTKEAATFPAATAFECGGPFTLYDACVGCCQREHNKKLLECFEVDGLDGMSAEPDADCKAARWTVNRGCVADCMEGRPFDLQPPGTSVAAGKLIGITSVTGDPPTGYVHITVSMLVGGISATWDEVLAGETLLAASLVYAFPANDIHIAAHNVQGGRHNVTLTVRVADTFVPKAAPASPDGRRRRLVPGIASSAEVVTLSFDIDAPAAAPADVEQPQQQGQGRGQEPMGRSRRSAASVQSLLDVITDPATAPLYAAALVATLRTANIALFGTVTITMASGAVVQCASQPSR